MRRALLPLAFAFLTLFSGVQAGAYRIDPKPIPQGEGSFEHALPQGIAPEHGGGAAHTEVHRTATDAHYGAMAAVLGATGARMTAVVAASVRATIQICGRSVRCYMRAYGPQGREIAEAVNAEFAAGGMAVTGMAAVSPRVLDEIAETVTRTYGDDLARNLDGATNRTGDLFDNPSQVVGSRIDELTAQIPENSRGRITMGVAVVEDAAGNRQILVSTSEPNGYLRPGVNLNDGEILVRGPRGSHAEADIVRYAEENGLTVVDIGATRPVCSNCQSVIPDDTNITTPLK